MVFEINLSIQFNKKNGELLFTYLDEVVEEIGEENVVQVITDNALNYVNVAIRLVRSVEDGGGLLVLLIV